MAGGGGWGDPLEREPAAVGRDVRNGKVSREAALNDYGVVLRDDNSVDQPATAHARAQRRAATLVGAATGDAD